MLLLNMDIRMALDVHELKETYCAPMNIDISMRTAQSSTDTAKDIQLL